MTQLTLQSPDPFSLNTSQSHYSRSPELKNEKRTLPLPYGGATSMSESGHRLRRVAAGPLCKQNSWSPDIVRDEAWKNRRRNNRLRRGRSVNDDDLDELRACFELGFNFDSTDLDPKLSSTFPALEFYHAVNRQYGSTLSRSSSASFSDCDSSTSSFGSPSSIIEPGEDPEIVKTKLKHWAQIVACSVRQVKL